MVSSLDLVVSQFQQIFCFWHIPSNHSNRIIFRKRHSQKPETQLHQSIKKGKQLVLFINVFDLIGGYVIVGLFFAMVTFYLSIVEKRKPAFIPLYVILGGIFWPILALTILICLGAWLTFHLFKR